MGAEKHPTDLRAAVGNREETLHSGHADFLHHGRGPLDRERTLRHAPRLARLAGRIGFQETPHFGPFAAKAIAQSYNKSVPKAKELESRLQRTEQQLQLFQKVSRLMVRELSLQEVLQGIVSLTVEFSQCDSCLVYLLDNDELVLCASNTPHPSTIGKIRLKLNEGLTGWVARERRLLSISREAYKVLATLGEQVGCVLVLARMAPTAVESANHVELVMSSGPIRPR